MKSLYGLPSKVVHCKFCLMSNQKPFSINETKNKKGSHKNGLYINKKGKCAACIYNEKKNININWVAREQKLKVMLDKFRKKNGSYDCIVSGSGGKDSSTIAHILKYKYNMNPLTVTYSPILYTEVGWRNLRNWIRVGGFDNYLFTPNGKISSILAKEAFKNMLHPIQPFKFGIKSFAAKMALKFDIELVMFGEPYAEYGSQSINDTNSPSYNEEWFVNHNKDIYLSGISIDQLKKRYQSITDNDLIPYLPIRSSELKKRKLNVEFLGWYLKWDPQEIYYYACKNNGFEVDDQRTDGTYGRYSGIDDKFEWLHYYCHYIKYGIGRARFDASQEIRSGHITREEGIRLCKKFEGERPKRYFEDCLNFMDIDKDEAEKIIDSFRSPHLWKQKSNKWKRIQELKELTQKE